jgi:hypothetical protein
MRIATLIIGLMVGALLFFQSMTLGMFSSEGSVNSDAASAGFLMALLWLLASALVIAFPRISMVLYGISALIGLLTPTGAFADLRFHGGVAVVLTVMAFFGYRGKRRHDQEVADEKARQMQRDMMLERMLRNQVASGPSPSGTTYSQSPIGTPYAPSPSSNFSAVYEPTQSNARPGR